MENHLPHTNNSPEISPATPEIKSTVSLGRRGFLCRTGIIAIALAGCNPDKEIQNSDASKTKTLEIKSVKDLERSAEILEDYQKNRMHHPDFVATKAARNNISKQPPHKLITEDSIPQDKSMTIAFSDPDGGNIISVTMPILKQDKKDLSKNECITGRTFVIKGKTVQEDKTYKIETAHPVKLDTGVANQFVLTSIDDRGVQKRYKILAVKRAAYKKSSSAYDTKSVVYTPPTSDFISTINIKAGKEYIDYVTHVASQILDSMLANSKLVDKDNKLKPIITNFRTALPFITRMVRKLMVIEHMDPNVYSMIKKGDSRYHGIRLADQVYTEYGINANQSFSFLENRQGAMGPLQIKADTYGYLMDKVPDRYGIDINILKRDDIKGRKDHIRAAVFAIILCYDNFLTLKYSLKDKHPGLYAMLGDKASDNYETLMVSNYNASTKMVHKSIDAVIESIKNKRWGAGITVSEFNTLYKKNIEDKGHKLSAEPNSGENSNYINKYFDIK